MHPRGGPRRIQVFVVLSECVQTNWHGMCSFTENLAAIRTGHIIKHNQLVMLNLTALGLSPISCLTPLRVINRVAASSNIEYAHRLSLPSFSMFISLNRIVALVAITWNVLAEQ